MRVSHNIPPGEGPFFDRGRVSFPGLNLPYWVSNLSGLLITSLPNQAGDVRDVADTVSSGHRLFTGNPAWKGVTSAEARAVRNTTDRGPEWAKGCAVVQGGKTAEQSEPSWGSVGVGIGSRRAMR